MLSDIFSLSEEAILEKNCSNREIIHAELEDEHKDKIVDDILPDREKAENAIWQGIKSEMRGHLEQAVHYYRLAIEYDREFPQAYRLLSCVLKKNWQNKEQLIESDAELLSTAKFKMDSNTQKQKVENRNDGIVAPKETVKSDKVKFKSVEAESGSQIVGDKPPFENINCLDVNLIPTIASLNVNNTNSSSQPNSEIVLLPNMETSPSGDLVLQDNLSVSQVYVQQAIVFFEEKEWDKSIAACQEALRICPNLGEAYKIWGNCLQRLGNSAEAMGMYAKALESQPNMAEIYCNLGSIYAQDKKWQQAIEHYQKSIIIDRNFAASHRNLARVWYELEEYDKSEECFFRAIAIKPELITAKNHFDLAHNLIEEDKLDKAIACYKSCIQLEPNFLNAYVRLAQLLEKSGQKDEALYYYKKLARLQIEEKEKKNLPKSRQQIHSFLFGSQKKSAKKSLAIPIAIEKRNSEQALPQQSQSQPTVEGEIAECIKKAKQQPNSASIQYTLGNLYAQTGQWQNAITYYLQSIKLAPRSSQYYLSLGKAWSKLGDLVKANQCFYQAFSLEPEKVKAQNHLLLGNKLLEQQQIKLAIACYRRAITQDPALVESYWQLGKILLSCGKEQGAIACYQQALKIEPNNPMGYFCLGNAMLQTKQMQAAVSCYQKAAQIDPNNADIKHNLGEVLFQQENWQDAANAYRDSIALNPDNSWSYNNLGDTLLKLERWQEAADSFRQAIALKPDFVWSHYNLGEALAELHQWDEALTAYQRAKQLDPQLPRLKQKIAKILRRRSKDSQHEALSYCKAQIEENPDDVESYHQAIALSRKDDELYLGLGKALFKQGKQDEAISIFQMGLEIQPDNPELILALNKAMFAKKSGFYLPDAMANTKEMPSLAADNGSVDSNLYDFQIPRHESPLVSIIIPVYNQISYTFNCLRSIAKNVSSDLAIEVIVVNDCSTDNTDRILKKVRGLKQINNSHNLGFLKSCNRGFIAAKGQYIYFLNNDTELRPQALEHLVSICQQDLDIGAVGSKLIYPDGSLQEAGGIIWQDASGWNYGRNENALAPQYNYLRPVDYCSGASLLVRKSALIALNGFDRDFAPAYYEDTDLCFAIRHRLGLKVMYQPLSEVIHHEGVSCGTQLSNGIKRYQSVNLKKFAAKWANRLQDYPLKKDDLTVAAASRRHSGNKTILVIDIYPPCYDKESGSRRIWQLLEIFKQLNYHVIFMPDNGAKEEPYVGMLQEKGIEVIYTQSGYGTPIEQQLQELLPLVDIAWICRPQLYEKYAPSIQEYDRIKLVYDTVDLHYLRLQRAGQFSNSGNSIESMREWVRMQSRELQAAHEADLTIAIAETEKEILQEQQVGSLAVVPNIHSPYLGDSPSFADRKGLLFIGSYNHPPNVDGVLWLVREIMPLVWQQIPELTVTLLGNNPTPKIAALKDSRIIVTGYVPDVTSYFLEHRVFVAPLRYGAGMKGKIGQSLEYGLPIVSTAIGIEGMNLVDEQNVLTANRSDEFAKQIIKLYRNENLWNKLANNSHDAIAFVNFQVVKQNLKSLFDDLYKK